MRTTFLDDGTVGTKSATGTKDLWLVYAPMSNAQAFTDALCALYYLPEQYKLMVVDSEVSPKMSLKHRDIMNRVRITEKGAELQETATPFAFIYGDVDKTVPYKTAKKVPTVVVTDQPEQYVKDNEWDGFTVPANNPEALASAILNIARTSFYGGLRLAQHPLTR